MSEAELLFEQLSDTQHVIEVLERVQSHNVAARGNGRSLEFDIAITRAIDALTKELHEEMGRKMYASPDPLHKPVVYVDGKTYDIIKYNPDGVFLDSQCQPPMLVKTVLEEET